MSSPVAGLMQSALEQIGAQSESHPLFDDERRRQLCRHLFDGYYYDKQDHKLIFDTNRLWSARLHQLVEMFDDFKVIACVRNPAWVLDSFERIYRRHAFDYSRLYGPGNRQTVYSRCETLIQANGVVGSAWTALKEAYYSEHSERLLIIDYDLLVQHPKRAMDLTHEFLSLKPFAYDFDNVEYAASEFDSHIGARDLHTVRRKVSYEPRRSILPPDLFQKYSEMAFWQDKAGTAASILAPAPANQQAPKKKTATKAANRKSAS